MEQSAGFKSRLLAWYEKNEVKLSIAFFLGGFLFDILTLSQIDDPLSIAQQVAYLLVTGVIVYVDFVRGADPSAFRFPAFFERAWAYRGLALHFLLGSLFSVYSLFFLMSSSIFTSIVFVLLLMVIMVLNELKSVQESGLDIKVSLYVVCVFCFFSLVIPVILGHVGRLPFLLSFLATLGVLGLFYRGLRARMPAAELHRRLTVPGLGIAGLFLLFYLIGLVPPVPLSAKKMGIYHRIEKQGGDYQLFHERPWWKFWQSGDQDFVARPGDKLHFFAAIFSPARFDDQVFVHWLFKDPKRGWKSSDRIPLHITGGRQGGFRGFTAKQNFQDGDWRVSVETSDGREIGRLYFTVTRGEADPGRTFQTEEY